MAASWTSSSCQPLWAMVRYPWHPMGPRPGSLGRATVTASRWAAVLSLASSLLLTCTVARTCQAGKQQPSQLAALPPSSQCRACNAQRCLEPASAVARLPVQPTAQCTGATHTSASVQQGQREEGSDPWGNLQTGVVDWSIRPKGGRAASTAAVKPGSRSASPVPSAASARSLPNLNGLDTTRDHPEGPSSPPGSNPPELQSDLGPAPVGTEVGALSDQTFHTGTSGSRDSPVDSLADSSTGTHQGDKGGPQLGAAEPSTEEADKVCSCWV